MTSRGGAEPARIFYGWWVALAFAVIIFVSTGIRFAVGPFLKPMAADLGLDRGSFPLVVVSISLFLYGAVMPLDGSGAGRPAPDRVLARREARPIAGGR